MAQGTSVRQRRRQEKPVFYLLAGPNGAGKSTLYKALVQRGTIPPTAEFVNADLYESACLQHVADPAARSEAARVWADGRRSSLLKAGHAFVSETVFSHESKLTLIQDAQQQGFLVMLLVVCLDDTKRLLKRVANRVREGGHNVPSERILARYPRTLANLAIAVRQADAAILYDSQAIEAGTDKAVAVCKGDETQVLIDPLPKWARLVLARDPSGKD
jgi:predicted ABC-type ATPase